MFCYKCGKKIEESAAFCPFCGTKQNTTGHNGNSAKNNASAFVGSENGQVYMGSQNTATRRSQMSDRNKLLIVIAGVVVVAVLVIIIIASNSRPTINMNDYLHVSDHGDDGHGSLIYSINYSKLKADYGGKLKLTSEGKSNDVMASAVAEGEDLIELIYDDISVSPENTRHLSNGDKVIFTWDTSDVNMLETYIMVSIEAEDYVYTVSNLEEAESQDLFNYVSVDFSGITPERAAEVSADCECLSPSNFSLDKSEGLSNGDTVTVSINDYSLERILSESGKALIESEKKYTVKGLDHYVTALSQIPNDDLEKMREMGEEKIDDFFDDTGRDGANEVAFLEYDIMEIESENNVGNKKTGGIELSVFFIWRRRRDLNCLCRNRSNLF